MRVGTRTLISLALCAAAGAAATAHFLIDVVGDYALRHDTYDQLRHGSRGLLTAVALAFAALLAMRGLRACCEIAARNRVRVTAAKFAWQETLALFAGVVVLTAFVVPAMEAFDAGVAGMRLGGLRDAFGGSLPIGLAIAVLCAVVAAASLFALARWLLAQRDSIAAIVATLLHRRDGEPPVPPALLERPFTATLHRRTLHGPEFAKRGPPEVLLA
ncbi:MAG: hypothetical protein JO030_04570 [Candidatus Eremiobacteraeota bacterium]|nr:hypothetical protein [Candidatus Eremiobacteraeota bacterium]